MSVLARVFEMALVLTFALFCINGMIFYFGESFIPNASMPLIENIEDQNTFVSISGSEDHIDQAADSSTPLTEYGYIENALVTLAFGFEIKLAAILSPYPSLWGLSLFIRLVLNIIKAVALIYLGFAAIGTPLGGSVP